MLLMFFFAGVLCACFGVSLALLRPTPAEGKMSLRLASIRTVEVAPVRMEDAALQHSDITWRDRLEQKLLAVTVGRSLRDLLVQSRSRRGLRSFLGISALLALAAGATVRLATDDPFAVMASSTLR